MEHEKIMAIMKGAFEYKDGMDFRAITQFRLDTVHAPTVMSCYQEMDNSTHCQARAKSLFFRQFKQVSQTLTR